MGDDMRNAMSTDSDTADFTELVIGLLRCYPMYGEAALDVVEQTEVLARLLN